MKRIFGFDLGTTSVGFAVIEVDNPLGPRAGRIERLGVRIFPEGVEPTGGGSTKAPPNQSRRKARLMRRQLRRKRRRRLELGQILAEAGLLPRFGLAPDSDWSKLMALDPYEIRAAALNRPLAPMALGRALYHLAKRRGFKGRRAIEEAAETKSREKEEEEGKVNSEITNLRHSMAGQTLGAFLAEQALKRFRPATPWRADRCMIEDEFERLWQAQARHHPDLLTDTLKKRLQKVVFFQRPTFWRVKTLGRCRLEPDAPLCPRGSWLGQRYLMLQRLNHLRFAFGNQRPLDDEERRAVLADLERRPHLTFGQIRKLLKPLWQLREEPTDRRFNFEVMPGGAKQDKTQIPGNLVEPKLAEVFGPEWLNHRNRDQIRREAFDRLYAIHYRRIGNKRIEIRPVEEEGAESARFIAEAEAEYGLAAEPAAALADWNPPSGWLRLSSRAVEKLLPHLEAGCVVSEAIDRAYPGHRTPEIAGLKRLPSHPRQMPDLRNPTVARTLTELRKVTNNLLAVYGMPDLIRIELARDLKLPKRVRDDLDARQRQQEAMRKRAREELQKNGFADPSRADEDKWLLWQECKETCPYTGRKIAFHALFGTPPEFEVEHILPRSRSFDNALANRAICEVAFNRGKGNRTPFEVFGYDTDKWQWFRDHLAKLGERDGPGRGLPQAKIRRFLRENYGDTEDQEFVARQLNDTAYASNEARAFLEQLGIPVAACNGRVTAQLRDEWGLNRILNPEGWGKSRADHRHHAIDALTVALTTPALVKRLSDFYAREQQGERPRLDLPWPNLWAEAKDSVERIVVSHRALRKVSGPLHDQSALGDTFEEVTEKGVTYRLFVKRVDLKGISLAQIEDIRDPAIKELVKDHLARLGGEPKKAFPPYPRLLPGNKKVVDHARGLDETAAPPLLERGRRGGAHPEIRKVRIRVKQQLGLMVPVRPEKKIYANAGENHHMAIFRTPEGKVEYEIVSRFEATKRAGAGRSVVSRSTGGRRLLMSLGIGDVLEFPNEGGPPSYRVVTSVWAAGPIVLQDARDAEGVVWKRPNASSLLRMGARKVRVDAIGRVTPAND